MSEDRAIDEQITLDPGDNRLQDIHDAGGNIIARVRLIVSECEKGPSVGGSGGEKGTGGGSGDGGAGTGQAVPFVPIGTSSDIRAMVERLQTTPTRFRIDPAEEGILFRFAEPHVERATGYLLPATFEPQGSEHEAIVDYTATVNTGVGLSLGPNARGIVLVFAPDLQP